VLAVGDAQFQKKCLGKMQDVSTKDGRTVLFVSHNMSAVRSLCSRAILLQTGQKVAEGAASEVLNIYQDQGVKEAMHRKWDFPRIDEFRSNHGMYLKEAKILIEGGDGDTIYVNTPFSLSFCVHTQRQAEVNLSPHWLGAGGEVLFASPSPQRRLAIGDNWFTCQMPPNLLNDEVYTVQLMIVEDYCNVRQVVNEVLTFEVHDIPRVGNWHGKWPGIVRPMLEWQFYQTKPKTEVGSTSKTNQ
jgi:lipopolysaccharide transport system ATP-binding protein